jgi:hypothetical protein
MTDFIDKYVLSDTTTTSPAIASLGPLYIAWKGDGNDNLNLMYSTDYGRTFQGKITFPETSPLAPALCAHNGKLILAWRGDGNEQLNVAQVDIQDGTIRGLLNKVILGETSPCSPSLASINGRLYLAWKGSGNDNFNILTSQDDGRSFGGKWTSPENTPLAPSICGHSDGRVYIAWKGDGNDNLNVLRLYLDGAGNVSYTGDKVTLPETSDDSPNLASFNGELFLAWRGSGNTNLNVASSSDMGLSFRNKIISSDTSDDAPSLCAYGRILAIAWRGRQSDSLNIAQATNYNLTGTARPLYKVLALIYAPPGTNGGKASSYVEYGTTSTTGTSTSISHSYKDEVDVSVSASLKLGVVNLGAGGEFDASTTNTTTDTAEIKKTTTSTIHITGPAQDGIDHDHDLFYLWLNPRLDLTLDPENNIEWAPNVDGQRMIIALVYVAWLKNPALMQQQAPDLARQLQSAGLTNDDFKSILSLNPFASSTYLIHSSIDTNRYLPTTQSFPYIPPLDQNDQPATMTETISDTVTQTHTNSVQTQYEVKANVSAGIGTDSTPISATLKANGSITWTDTSTTTSTNSSTQSATVSIGGPAFGYKGASDVLVYWDCIYNSFAFAFPFVPYFHSGSLVDAHGKAVAGKRVSLQINGHTYQTYTDANGMYRFYDGAGITISGAGTLTSENHKLPVAIGNKPVASLLRLTVRGK